MKSAIKKLLPKWLLNLYHYCFAVAANWLYGRPSLKMIVIGITGTKGKTSSANFIWSVLQAGGIKTGIISTANIRISEVEEENNFHMTMPGRFFIHKTLARMVKEKCEVAIIETTSQGISQFRHIGIAYDLCIFTNLTPEHIESHGSFEEYKKTKGKMFKALSTSKIKKWRGKQFPKTIIVNSDDDSSGYYLGFDASRKKTYSIKRDSDFRAESITLSDSGSVFAVNVHEYALGIPGIFNIYNALPAIAIGNAFDVQETIINEGLKKIAKIPGRLEEVQNSKGFRVFVDYAHEPAGLRSVIEAGNNLKKEHGRTIVLIGAPGGGRDKSKRGSMGMAAGETADIVIISDDEPYEDDPVEILEAVKLGALKAGKIENENLFVIGDRTEGIRKALSLAQTGDVVLFTGLGHQKARMIGKESVPWIEKNIVSSLLN